jgi:hypothetical protein
MIGTIFIPIFLRARFFKLHSRTPVPHGNDHKQSAVEELPPPESRPPFNIRYKEPVEKLEKSDLDVITSGNLLVYTSGLATN